MRREDDFGDPLAEGFGEAFVVGVDAAGQENEIGFRNGVADETGAGVTGMAESAGGDVGLSVQDKYCLAQDQEGRRTGRSRGRILPQKYD